MASLIAERTSSRGAGASSYSSHHTSPLRFSLFSVLLCAFTLLTAPVSADCECGYSAAIGGSDAADVYVFTDLIESNFAEIPDIAKDTDWVRQEFNMSATDARGNFGELFDINNVFSSSSSGSSSSSSSSSNAKGGSSSGNDSALELTVQSQVDSGFISGAEIDTSRLDVFWGTFRASMKLTDVSGTCAAWFWYYNDTEEIDMEFLSREYTPNNKTWPVNLVLQSRASLEAGFNAQGTGNFVQANLPFDPTLDFHEYRIDYLPNQVIFYADNQPLASMNGSAVPTHAGHMILQHWSNGNPLWSGGPPAQNATVSVQYVKAYFNSSSPARIQDFALRCTDPTAPNATCAIPNFGSTYEGGVITNSSSSNNSGGWFFSGQSNMTTNQTVFTQSGAARVSLGRVWWPVASALLLTSGWALGLW